MKFSIIIPFYNKWELTHQCLFDLYRYVTKTDVEVILVDDASTEPEIESAIGWWQKTLHGGHVIRYLKHSENRGFGSSMNDGCKLATGDVVVLLSNDVRVYYDFTVDVGNVLSENHRTLIGGEFLNRPTGWNEFEIGGKKGFVPYVNGWFLSCLKSSWDEIGGFDPIYNKFDFEDVDLSATALYLGYNLVGLSNPNLRHLGGQTVYPLYPDRQKYTEKNRQFFISKWGNKLLEVLCYQ